MKRHLELCKQQQQQQNQQQQQQQQQQYGGITCLEGSQSILLILFYNIGRIFMSFYWKFMRNMFQDIINENEKEWRFSNTSTPWMHYI